MNDDSDDRSNWKFGIFYFDSENQKVFVPKRVGIGWTLNFARWQTSIIIGALLIILGISFFTTLI
ncbi:MAG: DUF5808 domain-containing protein [Ignavibacteriales bacterium]|nr:DUF5808 domain-containing protein [Ignavibacteriales bacterium]